MNIQFGSVLVCLLVSSAMGEKGSVSFWHTKFTMTCPVDGTWHRWGDQVVYNESKLFTQEYNDTTRGYYYCKYRNDSGIQNYHFYVKAKVCDYCYELDPALVIGAICADFLVTLGVILAVYVRSGRTKSAGATPKTPKKASSASAGSTAPELPSHYEPLNRQANFDPYSVVHRTR